MPFFTTPASFRSRVPFSPLLDRSAGVSRLQSSATSIRQESLSIFQNDALPPHSSHPPFGHLILLVFEAVMEVVCVSFPGYIVARQGMFNAEMQKFAANLNVMLFTPCLIFTKLASQLTAEKLGELAVIPIIFLVQTLVSFLCSIAVAKLFGFKKRPRNFVIAMGVFGNSNSLPISLVISLSQTIKGLHWDKVAGDNDGEVAARGILYLLIFQQLGQLVRWSWGYHVLLAPPDKFCGENVQINSSAEGSEESYSDLPFEQTDRLIDDSPIVDAESLRINGGYNGELAGEVPEMVPKCSTGSQLGGSGERTPITYRQYTSSASSSTSSRKGNTDKLILPLGSPQAPTNGNTALLAAPGPTASDPSTKSMDSARGGWSPSHLEGWLFRGKRLVRHSCQAIWNSIRATCRLLIQFLPSPVQTILWQIAHGFIRFWLGVWDFMNPPLWAMLAAIIVASIPSLQSLFFSEGTFVKNSITSAIRQMGGVAVPLILVVLGANLEGKTQPEDPDRSEEDDKEETKLLIACLISRMLLPIAVMAPLLALAAKYVPVSILDDPIFVVVCFLLTGAPSALQLAQICQINGVYLGAMSRLLFQSYVVWILPSTLILVVLAIESLEFAQR